MRRRRAGGSSGATFAFAGLLALTLAVSGVLVSAPPASANEDCVTPTAVATTPAPTASPTTAAPSPSATTPAPTATPTPSITPDPTPTTPTPTPTVVCPAEELTFALVEEWQGGEFALTPDPTQTMLTGATVTGTIEGTHELELWVWVALDDTNGRTTYQRFTETYPVVWGATAFNGFALDPATGDLSVNLDELWDAENAAAAPATEALLAEHFDAFVADVEAQATALTAPGGEFV